MLAVALMMAALVLASQQDICGAQLSIHTDSNTNSFSLKAPGLQQTFTRYYGAARQQPQTQVQVQEAEQPQQQALLQQQQQEQLIQQYRLSRLRSASKPKIESSFFSAAQQEHQQQEQLQQQQLQQQQLQQQQLQQQHLQQQHLQQQQLQQNLFAGTGTGAGFFDYQRQRAEFEQQQAQQQLQQQQQQQQFLQNFYNYNSGSQIPNTQFQPQVQAQQQQQQQQPAEGFQPLFQRPQFGSNGLQPGSAPLRSVGAGDFYSSQQQQQQQPEQFATNQVAPTSRQNLGLPAPMSSSVPTFQPSSDVSHVSFSSGNLKYNF
ncbi:hypothetical protein KR059_005567 [Drosophila kikkawai]|nr:hypothetical protein KR059_005567 [Drosophila kikkawai]